MNIRKIVGYTINLSKKKIFMIQELDYVNINNIPNYFYLMYNTYKTFEYKFFDLYNNDIIMDL